MDYITRGMNGLKVRTRTTDCNFSTDSGDGDSYRRGIGHSAKHQSSATKLNVRSPGVRW